MSPQENLLKLKPAAISAGIGVWVGGVCGVASAVFLKSLEWATQTREAHPALLFGLPIAGIAIVAGYRQFGEKLNTDLLLARIHEPEGELPVRMAPMVLIGTVVTHLFGGSAGREGTALQIGGSLGLASVIPFRLSAPQKRLALMAGLAGGFGSVFGTPLAGAVFGMEVLTIGRVDYDGLIPCLSAGIVGDLVCRSLGIDHGILRATASGPPTELLVAVAVGIACALAARGFVYATKKVSQTLTAIPWWTRPVVGGLVFIGITLALGTHRYLGLSLPLLVPALSPNGSPWFDGPLKLLLTALTLGSGFKGGEVTPLFLSGAAIGSWIGRISNVLPDRMAAAGFVALFGAAANVPVAAWLMAVERFGSGVGVPAAVAVTVAYALSGHRGIYGTQTIAIRKG